MIFEDKFIWVESKEFLGERGRKFIKNKLTLFYKKTNIDLNNILLIIFE